jgi:hypothetical protein
MVVRLNIDISKDDHKHDVRLDCYHRRDLQNDFDAEIVRLYPVLVAFCRIALIKSREARFFCPAYLANGIGICLRRVQ